jgi:predicted HTH domain antitoxin
MKIALEKYIDEEFTLCKAAEFANVSIQRMARYAAERGIPFFRESLTELKRDIGEAEDWL